MGRTGTTGTPLSASMSEVKPLVFGSRRWRKLRSSGSDRPACSQSAGEGRKHEAPVISASKAMGTGAAVGFRRISLEHALLFPSLSSETAHAARR